LPLPCSTLPRGQTTTATLDSPQWTLTKSEIDLETGQPRTFYRKTGLKPDDWSNG